jgi:hypothetical protein
MNLRIRCASHNQVLKIFSSYDSNGETIIDVTPCPECAAQQNMHLTIGSLRYLQETLTPRQLSALKDLFTPPNGK